MNTSPHKLLLWLGGVLAVTMMAVLYLASASSTLAWMAGVGTTGNGSGGGGPCLTTTTTPNTTPTLSTTTGATVQPGATTTAALSAPYPPTPTVGGGQPSCFPPSSGYGAAVVQWARAMADALYVNPACAGVISYPSCYYTWYTSQFPQAVVQYGAQVCPGCAEWANGTYQCVSFVRGAYSQVYPMRLTANAFDLWATYQGQPGWLEIPSAATPPAARGLPEPGDIMVFQDTSIGHAAIVMAVLLPSGGQNGAVTFANSNSVSPYTTMPLLPDLTVDTASWPGYTVWGYIRPATSTTTAVGVSSLQLSA